MVKFHEQLTTDTVYARYFEHLGLSARTAHERLTRVCFNDYDREIALVAEQDAQNGERRIVAVGRLSKEHALPEAEFSLLVGDPWQGKGLGSELLRRLVKIGRDERLQLIWADMLGSNIGMRKTAQAAGFSLIDEAGGVVRAELRLQD
jgi:acetyltransferase